MMSTLRQKTGKAIYQHGTAFRSFAHFEEPNIPRREAMEDGHSTVT